MHSAGAGLLANRAPPATNAAGLKLSLVSNPKSCPVLAGAVLRPSHIPAGPARRGTEGSRPGALSTATRPSPRLSHACVRNHCLACSHRCRPLVWHCSGTRSSLPGAQCPHFALVPWLRLRHVTQCPISAWEGCCTQLAADTPAAGAQGCLPVALKASLSAKQRFSA